MGFTSVFKGLNAFDVRPQSGTSHKTRLRGFGGNGSIAWTSAVSHVGRTSNAFKVAMKLQTFLFLMVVTSCISVQYFWKYSFAKSSDNLYAPCILGMFYCCGNMECELPCLHVYEENLVLIALYRGTDKSLARPGKKQARKHVMDARDFNNIETWAVVKFFSFSCKARRRRKFTPFWQKQ